MSDKEQPSPGGELMGPDSQLPAAMQHHRSAMAIKDPILQMIAEASVNPKVDMDKFDRLMAWKDSEEEKLAKKKFNNAMSKCQKEIGRIETDSLNTQTSSRYASYAALDRVVRPIYTKHGFNLSFNTGHHDDPLTLLVLCEVSHKDGFTKDFEVPMPCDGKGAKGGAVMTKTHAAGSAMKYGQRYLLVLIFNLAVGQDDDGNQAGARPVERITESQAADLKALVEEIGGDPIVFLEYLRTNGVPGGQIKEISKASYADIVKAVERRRK